MTPEVARADYLMWARGGMRHIATCPFVDHPFHDFIHKRTDAASIRLDLAVAEHYRGRAASLHARQQGDAP